MVKNICVLGGMNMDIIGAPAEELCLKDSTPGRVQLTPGGVGRNMAENLVRMGFKVELMAPIGNDAFAKLLQESCLKQGISLRHAPRLPLPSGVYLCVLDNNGDMHIAINDVMICSAIKPQMIGMGVINASDGLLLDANLPVPVLEHVALKANVPIIADPVSAVKANRLLTILPRLTAIKPNLAEAQALTGKTDPMLCAKSLCCMGVKRAFVSAGPDGIYYCEGESSGHAQIPAAKTVLNATGAGDSATAAIAAGCLLGYPIEKTARLACRVAALTLQALSAVSPELSASILDIVAPK